MTMLSKKHRRSSTVQGEGLTNEGRHNLLLLHEQVHDKRGIAESLHTYITRARLTACEVSVFSREISQLSNICPPPSLWSYSYSLPRGVYFEITVCTICHWQHVIGSIIMQYHAVCMHRQYLLKPHRLALYSHRYGILSNST